MSFISTIKNSQISNRNLIILEALIIIGFASIPLLSSFPYRVNIFLSWEGAYRLYLGQTPYKDFGIPMGFAYWVIPAMFFKIFGPFMTSLIKAQVFINILSGFSFRSIVKSLGMEPGLKTAAVLLFCISYSFFNFWPWYNHTVIVYELIGLALLFKYVFRTDDKKRNHIYLLFSTFFIFFSFYTKQDGGALAFMLAFFLVIYHAICDKKYLDIVWFLGYYTVWVLIFIVPFLAHDFTYWFNLGQEPHNSRIQLWDFINVLFGESKWEKLYVAILIVVFLIKLKDIKAFFFAKKEFMFFLFTLGILVQALIFQVTSYTPPDNNIFFHSFAFAYLIHLTGLTDQFKKAPQLLVMSLLIMLWWSGAYWKYIERKVLRMFPNLTVVDENKISRSTYMLKKNPNNINMSKWVFSDIEAFKNIYMPESTVKGMERLMKIDEVMKPGAKILNMTELTPLAHAIGYELETNKPLWYHKGVGIFQKQIDEYIEEIENDKYDVVLFEYIPYLNNFYPDEVRDALKEHYYMTDEFLAPRRPTDSYVEVYIRKKSTVEDNKVSEVDEQVETEHPQQ